MKRKFKRVEKGIVRWFSRVLVEDVFKDLMCKKFYGDSKYRKCGGNLCSCPWVKNLWLS